MKHCAGWYRSANANLLQPFTSLGSFDLILCRNVLIYFDEATKRDILERMSQLLNPGVVYVCPCRLMF